MLKQAKKWLWELLEVWLRTWTRYVQLHFDPYIILFIIYTITTYIFLNSHTQLLEHLRNKVLSIIELVKKAYPRATQHQ